jgi:hypothetical protein
MKTKKMYNKMIKILMPFFPVKIMNRNSNDKLHIPSAEAVMITIFEDRTYWDIFVEKNYCILILNFF